MGIGCHSISGFLTPDNITNFTQMGGEVGAFWIGRAPFSNIDHTFQNLGDGTYTHSGYLAIRAAIASGVNMTFKILYNDAVAMTGGQDAMGGSNPDAIARQIAAEGIQAIAVVGDDPDGTKAVGDWPEMVQFHHRRDMVNVQEDMSKVRGVLQSFMFRPVLLNYAVAASGAKFLIVLNGLLLMKLFAKVAAIVR